VAFVLWGCTESEGPAAVEFRGNPISGELTGVLSAAGSPYLAVDTLFVPAGRELLIEPGVELRFDLLTDNGREKALPLEVYGKITAVGTEDAPIVFTSGRRYPDRGDWEGVWLIDADPDSRFEYCRFMFGGKYGRRYHYSDGDGQLDSTLFEYGGLTLFRSSPTVQRCWFLMNGFHGVHCDSFANPTVENCVFYDNAGHGIYVHWTADPLVRFNIVVENDDYGVFFREEGENPEPRGDARIDYNIVWSNFSGEFNEQAPNGLGLVAQVNGNLDSCDYRFNLRLNPAFVNPDSLDFRLNPNSAAIDAGPDDPGLRDPDGTRIELGIYAYHYRPGEIRRRITVERLEAASSPYYMSCDALLPAGQVLTIEPGVQVNIEGRFRFRIIGRLISEGTPEARVSFVSSAQEPKKGDWLGLIFDPSEDPGTVLRYTTVTHTRWGIRLTRRDVLIDHCRIIESDSVGILCDDFSSPVITDCEIADNSVAGVLCQFGSSPVIRRNRIHDAAGYGIYARESSRPIIENNIIYNCGINGIRLENLSSASIVNNTIASNGYFGLFCFNNSSPDVRNNIFYRNGDELRGGVGINTTRTSLPTIEYNGFWGHQVSAVSISKDTTAIDTVLNLFADPMFTAAETGDYHLQNGSRYIDAGDPALADPDGSRSDIGAYGGPGASP